MKRILLLASASLLFVATSAGVAQAHPAYKDSSPQAGASVGAPPSELWVEFTERIEGGSVTITDPCGDRADHGEDEMNLTSDRLTTGMHGDKAGTYVVQWSVLGSDGHTTRGEFTFTASDGAACPGTNEPDPDPDPNRDPKRDRTVKRSESLPADTDDDPETTNEENRRVADRSRSENERERDASSRRAPKADRRVDLAQSPSQTTETGGESIWDGIPMGDFFVALGVAALIGAAGGRIYAGIVGPRR